MSGADGCRYHPAGPFTNRLLRSLPVQSQSTNTRHDYTPTSMVTPAAVSPPCPACGSGATRVRSRLLHADGRVTRYRRCLGCRHRFATADADAGWLDHPRRRAAKAATEKYCTKCKLTLPVGRFGKKANDPDLYRSSCNQCLAEYRRNAYGKRSIRSLYGLSPEQYAAMLARQAGKCLVCGLPERGKRGQRKFSLAVDHCHATGVVRGLLCNKCNLGIGNFDDDPARLEAAAAYIRRRSRPSGKEV